MLTLGHFGLLYKTLFSERGAVAPKIDFPLGHFHLPRHYHSGGASGSARGTMLNEVESRLCPNITYRTGQVRVLFSLPHCPFLLNSLATCKGASVYVARCLPVGIT